MASRREWRVPFAATVRVVGTSRSGESYSRTAQTLDVSRRGVRLNNAEFLARVGELVTLQHQQRRAKYRVVWVGGGGGAERGLAGLQLLEGQAPIWGLDPGTGRPDTFDARQRREPIPVVAIPTPPSPAAAAEGEPPSAAERRAAMRYDCDRAVACWRAGSTVPVWGKLRDVSLNSCSVEAPITFEVDTNLRMVLLVHGIKVRAEGAVRRSGDKIMGVQLTRIHRDDYHRFQAVINGLAQPPGEAFVPANISETMLRQIESWFEDRELLSRDELHDLLDAAKKRTTGPPPKP